MSVQQLSNKHYNSTYKAIKGSYHSSKQQFEFNGQTEADPLLNCVRCWQNLNEKSYCNKYGEKFTNEQFEPSGPWVFLDSNEEVIKALQCITYQINQSFNELNDKEKEAMYILIRLTNAYLTPLVNGRVEFQKLPWSI